jgi:hypothetical protein
MSCFSISALSYLSLPLPPPPEKIIPLSGNVEHKRQSYEQDRSDGGPYPACSHISRLGSVFYPPAPDTGGGGGGASSPSDIALPPTPTVPVLAVGQTTTFTDTQEFDFPKFDPLNVTGMALCPDLGTKCQNLFCLV